MDVPPRTLSLRVPWTLSSGSSTAGSAWAPPSRDSSKAQSGELGSLSPSTSRGSLPFAPFCPMSEKLLFLTICPFGVVLGKDGKSSPYNPILAESVSARLHVKLITTVQEIGHRLNVGISARNSQDSFQENRRINLRSRLKKSLPHRLSPSGDGPAPLTAASPLPRPLSAGRTAQGSRARWPHGRA